jgi:hypothetical protein
MAWAEAFKRILFVSRLISGEDYLERIIWREFSEEDRWLMPEAISCFGEDYLERITENPAKSHEITGHFAPRAACSANTHSL